MLFYNSYTEFMEEYQIGDNKKFKKGVVNR